jgi:hypothetical protein
MQSNQNQENKPSLVILFRSETDMAMAMVTAITITTEVWGKQKAIRSGPPFNFRDWLWPS